MLAKLLIVLAISIIAFLLPWSFGQIVGSYFIGAAISWAFALNSIQSNKLLAIILCFFCKRVRLSVSYLFKIELDGRYLLIKGHRIQHQYQPVGGVFKYKEGALGILDELKRESDDKLAVDETSKNDLRIYISGSKVSGFFKWFDSRKYRELSPERELREELFVPGILSDFSLTKPDFYQLIGTKITFKHKWLSVLKCHELLYAEIYSLDITQNQWNEVEALMKKEDKRIGWFTKEEIVKRGISEKNFGAIISEHSQWIL